MRNREPNPACVIPPEILALLSSPPVRSSEDVKRWYAVFNSIARWLRPKDIFEWFWAWDLTAERWEMDRQRKTKVVVNAVQRAIVEERAGIKQTKAEARFEASLKDFATPYYLSSGERAQREPLPATADPSSDCGLAGDGRKCAGLDPEPNRSCLRTAVGGVERSV